MIDRDRDLYSTDFAHIRDKQAFALRPFSYRTPATGKQDMDHVRRVEHALYGSEASLDKKSWYVIQYKSECGGSLTLVCDRVLRGVAIPILDRVVYRLLLHE